MARSKLLIPSTRPILDIPKTVQYCESCGEPMLRQGAGSAVAYVCQACHPPAPVAPPKLKLKKSAKKEPVSLKPPGRPPKLIPIDPVLEYQKATPKTIASGKLQQAFLAAVGPQLIAKALRSTMRALDNDDSAAARKEVYALYEMIQQKNSISVFKDMRQVNIDARNAASDAAGGGRRSFENTARLLEAAREKRISQGNPLASRIVDVEINETPEGMSK